MKKQHGIPETEIEFHGLCQFLPPTASQSIVPMTIGSPENLPIVAFFYLLADRHDDLYQRISSLLPGGMSRSAFDSWLADNESCVDRLISLVNETDQQLCRHHRKLTEEEILASTVNQCVTYVAAGVIAEEFLAAISMRYPLTHRRWYLSTTTAHQHFVTLRASSPVYSAAEEHWAETLSLCVTWLQSRYQATDRETLSMICEGYTPLHFKESSE